MAMMLWSPAPQKMTHSGRIDLSIVAQDVEVELEPLNFLGVSLEPEVLFPIMSLESEGDEGTMPQGVDRRVELLVTGPAPIPLCSDSSSGLGAVSISSEGTVVVPEFLPLESAWGCLSSGSGPNLSLRTGGSEVPLEQGDFLRGLEEFKRLLQAD